MMMLKRISLAAALAATFITGNAAVAYAEGDAGIHDAVREITTSAALEREFLQRTVGYAYFPGSYAAAPGYDSPFSPFDYGYGGYAYAPERRLYRPSRYARR
jgi:hypothetical protein